MYYVFYTPTIYVILVKQHGLPLIPPKDTISACKESLRKNLSHKQATILSRLTIYIYSYQAPSVDIVDTGIY